MIAELTARGVHRDMAAELVQEHPADAIRLKMEVFDWLTGKDDKRVAKNPPGYLLTSIAKDYPAPKGFVSAADRQKQQEAKQAKERLIAEKRRREQAKDARDRDERRKIEAFWDALSPQDQAAFDVTAQADADPEMLKSLVGPMKRMGVKIIRDSHIAKLLRAKGELPPVSE